MTSNSIARLRINVPLEITVRLADATLEGDAQPSAPGPVTTPRTLTHGAEAVQVDQDYSNRAGYAAQFIPGFEIGLPSLSGALAKQLAPLRDSEPDARAGELKYEHFSIKLNRSKRIAIFTATNIDGASYLNVDRATGQINSSEGDTWFKDPRVSASFYLDQSFYGAWSAYFDRGHLTRRTDPTWGSQEEVERANADTFHFTNCSPQHFRFNESAVYWQGLERYVLENGALELQEPPRLVVMQGPIFDDAIDMWADDVQIPSSFFKIAAWKSKGKLKAVGLVCDQLKLLSEARHGSLGKPRDLPSIDVNHWRVGIPSIETRTGLDFGQQIRAADTIAQAEQPAVGEARVLVRRFEDIVL
jgi:endonuclease G